MFNEGRKIAYTIFVNFNVTYSLNVVEKRERLIKLQKKTTTMKKKKKKKLYHVLIKHNLKRQWALCTIPHMWNEHINIVVYIYTHKISELIRASRGTERFAVQWIFLHILKSIRFNLQYFFLSTFAIYMIVTAWISISNLKV